MDSFGRPGPGTSDRRRGATPPALTKAWAPSGRAWPGARPSEATGPQTSRATTSITSSPYRSSFVGPTPGTRRSSAMERGRAAAIASIVVSWKMMNGATRRSGHGPCARHGARSRAATGRPGRPCRRAGAWTRRAPLYRGSDPGPTHEQPTPCAAPGHRESVTLPAGLHDPSAPARDVAHDSQR